MTEPDVLYHLLQRNTTWAARIEKEHPNFFKELAKKQSPRILWIGCCDSRVPESVITDSLPGVIFVHRNIANQVPLEDDNTMSAVEYSVNHLPIEHIVVVGHTKCGGCEAALKQALVPMPDPSEPHVERWIQPIIKLAISLKPNPNEFDKELQRLIEANVAKQVINLSQSKVVIGAPRNVSLHGWMYDLSKGLLSDMNIKV